MCERSDLDMCNVTFKVIRCKDSATFLVFLIACNGGRLWRVFAEHKVGLLKLNVLWCISGPWSPSLYDVKRLIYLPSSASSANIWTKTNLCHSAPLVFNTSKKIQVTLQSQKREKNIFFKKLEVSVLPGAGSNELRVSPIISNMLLFAMVVSNKRLLMSL
jgi:hypothetical protein